MNDNEIEEMIKAGKAPEPPKDPEALKQTLALNFAKHAAELRDNRKWKAAEVAIRRCIGLEPKWPETSAIIGNVLFSLGRYEEAAGYIQRAMSGDSNLIVPMTHNLGLCHFYRGQVDAAIKEYEKVASASIDAAWDLAHALMLKGDWSRGWPLTEIRRRRLNFPKRACPEWNGQKFDGTLWVASEQGAGDNIMFSRYLRWAKSQCRRLVMSTFPTHYPLFQGMPWIDELVPAYEGVGEPKADFHVPIASLPVFHKTTTDTIPDPTPSIKENAKMLPMTMLKPPTMLAVGIVWAGNADHAQDHMRSIAFDHFLGLGKNPKIQLYSFQAGPRAEDLYQAGAQAMVAPLGHQLKSWLHTASALQHMDVVVTVDTGVAHLAATLGVPTWIALPRVPDWRWGLNRVDSPWYASVKLFRQHRYNDWEAVFQDIADDLAKLARDELAKRVIANMDLGRD